MPSARQKPSEAGLFPVARKDNFFIRCFLDLLWPGRPRLAAFPVIRSVIAVDASRMRRRLLKYLPIVLIALMVQILAPMAACWAAAVTASDPLLAAEICHDDSAAAGQSSDQGGQHHEHGATCSMCCLASASASVDTPTMAALAAPYRHGAQVIWHDRASDLFASRIGSNAQARAPPQST